MYPKCWPGVRRRENYVAHTFPRSFPRLGWGAVALLVTLLLGLLAVLPVGAATWASHEVYPSSIENSSPAGAGP